MCSAYNRQFDLKFGALMQTTHALVRNRYRIWPGIIGFISLLLASGCGLALDSEDRLERGELALVEGDVRAAIIDAKDEIGRAHV
jgi:hypothetical protein